MATCRSVRASVFGAAVLIGGATLVAGPLDPPAGPIKSTFKTLREVEPRVAIDAGNTPGDTNSVFKITQPGSYYLTGNVAGSAGKHGIEIDANNVTIDLNGFEVNGNVGSSLSGIWTDGFVGRRNITVVNGTVRNWGESGIDMFGVAGGRISGVTASNNGATGIGVGTMFHIGECLATGNDGSGIRAAGGGTMSECRSQGNAVYGIDSGDGSTLTRCTAESNGVDGIAIRFGGVATGCTASHNEGDGFYVNSGSRLVNCVSTSNDGDGVYASAGSSIMESHFERNGLDGAGAGIRVFGPQGRIEGNTCHDNEIGIEVLSAGNIIVRNSCSSNGVNWVIAGNNVFGPIIDRTSPGSGAVNGNSASETLGSAHPNANFTY